MLSLLEWYAQQMWCETNEIFFLDGCKKLVVLSIKCQLNYQ